MQPKTIVLASGARVTLRIAAAGDAPGIGALFAALRREANPFITPNFLSDADARRFASGSDCLLAVVAAAERGPLAAFASLFRVGRDGRIVMNAIHPEWRGQGLGRALLDFTLAVAAGRGLRRVTLGVFETNEAARRLYEKSGFTVHAPDSMQTLRHLAVACRAMGPGSTLALAWRVWWKTRRRREPLIDMQLAVTSAADDRAEAV